MQTIGFKPMEFTLVVAVLGAAAAYAVTREPLDKAGLLRAAKRLAIYGVAIPGVFVVLWGMIQYESR